MKTLWTKFKLWIEELNDIGYFYLFGKLRDK